MRSLVRRVQALEQAGGDINPLALAVFMLDADDGGAAIRAGLTPAQLRKFDAWNRQLVPMLDEPSYVRPSTSRRGRPRR